MKTKSERGPRSRRSITAYPEEYKLIARFISAVKDAPEIAEKHLKQMELSIKQKKIDEFAKSL